MLAKRIIPCLDVTGGRVVKGVHFVNLRDAGDPVELADRYNQQGADELVFLDITASSDNRDTMADVVARIAQVDEVDTLDHAAGGHVETGDNALGQHQSSTKFFTILSPSGPDFSGWNCTPKTLSLSRTAV